MRDGVGRLPWMRRAGSALWQPDAVPAARAWVLQGMLVWAVLAGLFFMHGAAPQVGCHGGSAVTRAATPSMPLMSSADTGSAASGAAHLSASGASGNAAVVAIRHAVPMPSVPQLTAPGPTAHDGGMLCSTRQPRESFVAGATVSLVAAVLLMLATATVVPSLGAVLRRTRPPGRPGLPLPLFLGVSRT